MPKLRSNAVPSYRLHKQSGQAVVTLSGRDVLLGHQGTSASKVAYDRAMAEWVGNGRCWHGSASPNLSVPELFVRYVEHARVYYGRSGELDNIRHALRPLKNLYADSPAAAFGPLALAAVREALVRQGLSRTYVNQCVGRIKRVFKWAWPTR